jgi:hypothetical protein
MTVYELYRHLEHILYKHSQLRNAAVVITTHGDPSKQDIETISITLANTVLLEGQR